MTIKFQLDIEKVIATALYIAKHDVPDLTVGKMMKLIFLADKYHLVKYGRPITGDKYDAMQDGPVPSFAYDLFKDILRSPKSEQGKRLAASLVIDETYVLPRFSTKQSYDADQLSRSDIRALDKTIGEFGGRKFEELSSITHAMAAYDNAWKSKSVFKKKAEMKFEDFFIDDSDAVAGAKEEMMENCHLRQSFAKP